MPPIINKHKLHSSDQDAEGQLLLKSRKVLRITNSNAGYLEGSHAVHVINVLNSAIRHAERVTHPPKPMRTPIRVAEATSASGKAMEKIISAVNDYNDVVSDYIGINQKRTLKKKARDVLAHSLEAIEEAKVIVQSNPGYPAALRRKIGEAKIQLESAIKRRARSLNEGVDVDKTLENWGAKLQATGANGDDSFTDPKSFINSAIAADPTPNKKYVLWMVRTYINGGINRAEDLGRAGEALAIFDKHKSKMTIKDIGQVKQLGALEDMTEPFQDAQTGKEAKRGELDELVKAGEVKVLIDNDRYRAAIPKTENASCVLGRNTRWCTASKNNNEFSSHAKKGNLIVVLDKKNNARWQLHFQTQQFMNEKDQPVPLYKIMTEFKELAEVPEVKKHFEFTKDGYLIRY